MSAPLLEGCCHVSLQLWASTFVARKEEDKMAAGDDEGVTQDATLLNPLEPAQFIA